MYRQGAQIKRTATSVVPAGTATLVFPGLPTSIDPSEVRITGTGDFTILSVTHRYHTDTLSGAESQAERQRLQLERNSLYHDMQQEQHWYTILDKEEQLLASHTQFTVKDSGVDLNRLIDATRFMRERRIELLQERQAIDQRIGDMQALTKLDQAMAALPPSARRPTELLIHTEANAQTSGAISFGYWMACRLGPGLQCPRRVRVRPAQTRKHCPRQATDRRLGPGQPERIHGHAQPEPVQAPPVALVPARQPSRCAGRGLFRGRRRQPMAEDPTLQPDRAASARPTL